MTQQGVITLLVVELAECHFVFTFEKITKFLCLNLCQENKSCFFSPSIITHTSAYLFCRKIISSCRGQYNAK